ncbi:outer membrane transport energization protein TonB [Desulfatibacillum alkenivorans DSM 16219]|uniref:Outer membrane transport energization protein TonB n=1 Tax=Desulfatibacillum alkenivorans DSM 16219 TaxID=1121393 RepID=A0A1M6JSX0_9BACT|nr:energy transducer TonB [Desulfatibacillum alkenivorans]SHJ49746.1 outer membrane transport energization protein TonB [Desulfatibacillum alkenivorans DSM 16219]
MGEAVGSQKQFGLGEGKAWALAIVIALVLNLIFFGLMPGLMTRAPREQPRMATGDPVRIERLRPPEPEKPRPPVPQETQQAASQPVSPMPQANAPDASRPDIAPVPLELNPALPPSSVSFPAPEYKTVPLPDARPAPVPAVAHQGLYEISELDAPPRRLSGGRPVYPLRAKRMGVEGSVKVRFIWTKEGKIRDIQILEADPPGFFEKSAKEYLDKILRLSIGTKDGVPVDYPMTQTLHFRLGGEE